MTQSNRPLLIVVVGPTGAGKTDLAIELALHFGASIISTDSRQLYRGMAIGTAQPTADQLSQVEHYLIANHHITDEYSCGSYEQEALSILSKLFESHNIAVAVGGSGLYINALCNGMDTLPDGDVELRSELNARLESEGLESLYEELMVLDPQFAAKVDSHNPRRVIRALEVCRQSGEPFSCFRKGVVAERDFDTIKIGVTMPRDLLYERINRRVDNMLAEGLVEEAEKLYSHRELNSLQTVGYRELFDYFDGKTPLAQAVELIKRNSRRYAKRQMTWFNRDPQTTWFEPHQTQEIIAFIDSKQKRSR